MRGGTFKGDVDEEESKE